MSYDTNQLEKDICLIVDTFGKLTPFGFYTVGIYEEDDVKLIDTYIYEKYVMYKGELVDTQNIKINSYIGKLILEKAIKAEEIKEGLHKQK